ncbi:nucleotidyltransferase family protein [Campylobacter sp. IFREMER_LSEM_CL2101]|uniref:nucleotidyltransferase family protein n=1 Tax=Campylobacter sp. IFREMER_LSEM_CL2101 TaxID=2911618 RepID=UPI0021E89102|nr:nucleotidyltransferase family protein [Campylobacter sp. IFREMER_LSEM_CL2101]MCV3391538.1 nucleotidyltransferase family protein [Campylobacter sp. IFREMER_LSEM_CL2101]
MRYISKSITIKEALELLSNHTSMRLLVIGDKDKWGIITDPDIRKALLNNMTLEDKIEKIVNYNPITVHCNDDKEKIMQLSVKYNIYQIPIVDDNGYIIRVENVLEDKIINKTNKIVVMAGGLGTRLRPLTENIPKPMLKVGDKPILEIIIKKFKKQGFTNFILCVNYKAEVIQNYFKDGKDFGVSISYVREDKRMGTAGALSLIEDIGKEPFFVTNGDILTEVDCNAMLEFHIANKSLATMGVRKHFYQIPYGVIVSNIKNQILKIEEKPEQTFLINSGIYILDPKILSYIPKNDFFDMPTLFENIQENNKYAYLIEDYWIDIGRHEEYQKANSDISYLGI